MLKRKLDGDGISVKRPKHVMSISKEVELLNLLASKKTVASVARRYNISESTLRYLQSEEAIRYSVAAGNSKSAKVCYVCRRDNVIDLHNVKLVGESASADHEAAQNFPPKLLEVIIENNYAQEQVFNVDETGLFRKRMPSRTFLSEFEKTAPGFSVERSHNPSSVC